MSDSNGSAAEVFRVFLKLGLTSFGGPVAHLGYFREELVVRRRWLTDAAYADLVALCQFLPGPTSSQAGFAVGLTRAGWAGAAAAFVGFTLPSALIMLAFAMAAPGVGGPFGEGLLHGLKLVAVAIVAQALWGMARSLTPDAPRVAIAVVAIAVLMLAPGAVAMMVAILIGAVAGLMLRETGAGRAGGPVSLPVSARIGWIAAVGFLALLVLLPLLAEAVPGLALADSFYRAGSLVFGGGHVVLPLLDAEMVQTGRVSADQFLAGYGAAQALPGPLFTFAAYLGTVVGASFWAGLMALAAIFLPGFLILIAALPFWSRFRQESVAQRMMQGSNAAVVGILAAALYDPVFVSAVHGVADLALAVGCFALLMLRVPPWVVVVLAECGGIGLALV
ncbi:chromate efflux transporter [Paracoccus caeni]|uniref:Chromate efflux transporter n=1 Tax=Paracoccus caeni TaxID=657651 RepID=A0A934VZX4_9RHOB|nr:chromate efflux transporter [Paracoccus caeni]MBK4217472.1 chromate efflux transporter [Paracoccus caeni]